MSFLGVFDGLSVKRAFIYIIAGLCPQRIAISQTTSPAAESHLLIQEATAAACEKRPTLMTTTMKNTVTKPAGEDFFLLCKAFFRFCFYVG